MTIHISVSATGGSDVYDHSASPMAAPPLEIMGTVAEVVTRVRLELPLHFSDPQGMHALNVEQQVKSFASVHNPAGVLLTIAQEESRLHVDICALDGIKKIDQIEFILRRLHVIMGQLTNIDRTGVLQMLGDQRAKLTGLVRSAQSHGQRLAKLMEELKAQPQNMDAKAISTALNGLQQNLKDIVRIPGLPARERAIVSNAAQQVQALPSSMNVLAPIIPMLKAALFPQAKAAKVEASTKPEAPPRRFSALAKARQPTHTQERIEKTVTPAQRLIAKLVPKVNGQKPLAQNTALSRTPAAINITHPLSQVPIVEARKFTVMARNVGARIAQTLARGMAASIILATATLAPSVAAAKAPTAQATQTEKLKNAESIKRDTIKTALSPAAEVTAASDTKIETNVSQNVQAAQAKSAEPVRTTDQTVHKAETTLSRTVFVEATSEQPVQPLTTRAPITSPEFDNPAKQPVQQAQQLINAEATPKAELKNFANNQTADNATAIHLENGKKVETSHGASQVERIAGAESTPAKFSESYPEGHTQTLSPLAAHTAVNIPDIGKIDTATPSGHVAQPVTGTADALIAEHLVLETTVFSPVPGKPIDEPQPLKPEINIETAVKEDASAKAQPTPTSQPIHVQADAGEKSTSEAAPKIDLNVAENKTPESEALSQDIKTGEQIETSKIQDQFQQAIESICPKTGGADCNCGVAKNAEAASKAEVEIAHADSYDLGALAGDLITITNSGDHTTPPAHDKNPDPIKKQFKETISSVCPKTGTNDCDCDVAKNGSAAAKAKVDVASANAFDLSDLAGSISEAASSATRSNPPMQAKPNPRLAA